MPNVKPKTYIHSHTIRLSNDQEQLLIKQARASKKPIGEILRLAAVSGLIEMRAKNEESN